jgi:sugar lactone lactonase YvrE
VKTVARQPLGSDYVVANGSLYFITHGVLMSALGTSIRRLASLAALGISPGPWLQSLGRLLELQDNSRLVVVRPDGSEFAWTQLPRTQGQAESISSSLVVAPRGNAVAFTAAAGESNDPNSARRARGTETVYLLRPGGRVAVPVHSERVDFKVCERGASLQWHGKWLLYSNSEGNLAAIDTSGHDAIELSGLVHGLPGTRDGFSASWGGPARVVALDGLRYREPSA